MKALIVKTATHAYEKDDILCIMPDTHEFNEYERTKYKEVLNIAVNTDLAQHTDEKLNPIALEMGLFHKQLNKRRKYKYTNKLENKNAH